MDNIKDGFDDIYFSKFLTFFGNLIFEYRQTTRAKRKAKESLVQYVWQVVFGLNSYQINLLFTQGTRFLELVNIESQSEVSGKQIGSS